VRSHPEQEIEVQLKWVKKKSNHWGSNLNARISDSADQIFDVVETQLTPPEECQVGINYLAQNLPISFQARAWESRGQLDRSICSKILMAQFPDVETLRGIR